MPAERQEPAQRQGRGTHGDGFRAEPPRFDDGVLEGVAERVRCRGGPYGGQRPGGQEQSGPSRDDDPFRVEQVHQVGDLATIAAPLDWLGLNYYFRDVVADDPRGPLPYARQVRVPDVRRTAMDWEVHADGLEQLLVRLTDEYGARRILVTENGSG